MPSIAGAMLLACLLAGCSHQASSESAPSVAVTTAMPKQQTFVNRVTAFGTAIGSPHASRRLDLAHAGQIVAVLVSDGQSVRAGQSLLKIATAPATRTAFVQARNALTLARQTLARDQHLATRHLATQAQVEAARQSVNDAKAALQAQRQLGGGKTIDTVTAPATGIITDIRVTRGQRVPANTTLATFTPAHGLIARLGVQPDQVAHLAMGMPVTLHAIYGSLPAAKGSVSMVGHAVDPATHLVPVLVSLPATWASRLMAGSALSAHIQTTSFVAWAVPRNALQSDAQGAYVFQIEHGKAHRVNVKVLSPGGSPVGVHGTIDPRAPVITLGSYEVADGDAVHATRRTPPHTHGAATR
ncbi:MAG TPA: efflux RND transporter periplasmic adaptor subunit [Rhodanobacteraceae bacterium]